MSAYTSRPAGQRIQVMPPPIQDEEGGVFCPQHKRRCKQLTSKSSANPGRHFYNCPLPRDDSGRCKFFAWADELPPPSPQKAPQTNLAPQTPSRVGTTGGQVLGRAPTSAAAVALNTPKSLSRKDRGRSESDDGDDLDWEGVDLDKMEKDAIASSQQSSARKMSSQESITSTPTVGFNDRLNNAVSGAKRSRDDDEATSPRPAKRPILEQNPFLTGSSPAHPSLMPTIATLQHVSDDLYRRDRKEAATEQMKESMRKKIRSLEEKNQTLEERNRVLEARVRQLEAMR
ncbi:hypothetical protein B9479_000518 [Cryptococcus floricola]|uniref:GRF-type domain-containing protein n=1 Tax=Cryptococcus floricola TaxID=2591691 RepID=A0A5D3B6W8_9TREE|nr:hypothetical protein B9479_000518 [Cryptococcus floricola]